MRVVGIKGYEGSRDGGCFISEGLVGIETEV